MPEINMNVEHQSNNIGEEKNTYLPPALTLLVDLDVEGVVGSGADAGGYAGHHHS